MEPSGPLESIRMEKKKAILQLRTPATPEHAATVRLFLAESGRHFQVAEDSMTDLKIAATEAFAMAAGAPGKATLLLEVRSSGEDMNVTISAPGGFDHSSEPETGMPGVSGPAIIEALFPDTRPDASGALHFSVPIGSG